MKQLMGKIRTAECRIGVVGLYNSGKTVLLTSLINHLQDHDPDRFRLGDGTVTLRKFRELPPDPGWVKFNYRQHREQLVHGQKWPIKTKDRSQYVCEFERSDWRLTRTKLKLYDLPGERIADAIMAVKDYPSWSDHMLELLGADKDCRGYCGEFLSLVAAGKEVPPDDLLRAYRVGLARLILSYKPYVSPSTFFLDTQGQMVRVRNDDRQFLSPENIAEHRYSGLAPDGQFAPLPVEWRTTHPELAEVFAGRYNLYKSEVVLPLVKAIKSCHSLIYLVDVLTLLANGHGMYNDNRQVLLDLLEVFKPGEGMVGKAMRLTSELFLPHSWRPGWITRIAFVAPKMDLVYPDDRDRMIDLVRRLVERRARDRDGLAAKYLNCSAVVSTQVFGMEGEARFLTGMLRGERKKFQVPALPEDWPQEWPSGQYVFQRVSPAMPPLRDCPPDQVNLDKLLDFLTN